jgi:hypothetical protein
VDGSFKETGSFVNNPNLARWATLSERFDYYHGHRAGRKARRRRSGGLPKAHERSLGRNRAYRKGGIAMAKAWSLWGQLFLSNPAQVDHEEKVLRYIIHRIDRDADLHEVLEEPYVRRNCSQVEIDEIASSADLVHAVREHLEQRFRSGDLDPGQRRQTGRA